MRRYNAVPLIPLILLIINFASAVPVLAPEKCLTGMCADVAHAPEEAITVLGKRGDELEKVAKLMENFGKWWGDHEEVGPPSPVHSRPSSESAPASHGSGQTSTSTPASASESRPVASPPSTDPPNPPSARSSSENLQTANDELKGEAKVSRRITGTPRGDVNAAQSELLYL